MTTLHFRRDPLIAILPRREPGCTRDDCWNEFHPDRYGDAPPESIGRFATFLSTLERGFEVDANRLYALGIGYNALSPAMKHFNPHFRAYPDTDAKIPPPGSKADYQPFFEGPSKGGKKGSGRARGHSAAPTAAGTPVHAVQSAPVAAAAPPVSAHATPTGSQLETLKLMVETHPKLGRSYVDAVEKAYSVDTQAQVHALEVIWKSQQ